MKLIERYGSWLEMMNDVASDSLREPRVKPRGRSTPPELQSSTIVRLRKADNVTGSQQVATASCPRDNNPKVCPVKSYE